MWTKRSIPVYSCAMIGFLLKKTFFDGWDNLFRLALVNIGFIASAALPILVPSLLVSVPLLAIAVAAIGVLWCFVYLTAAAICLKTVSDYGGFGFADFFVAVKDAIPSGLILGLIVGLLGLFGYTALPFYFSMKSPVGIFAAALVFWSLVIAAFALQYYLPIRARLDRDPRKIIKKCFILFFDNPGLSIFASVHNLILLGLSFFLAFLIPGPAAMILFMDEALRLRLMKYDYLEANPDANRRKIPWDELLVDEREKTGTRSLRSFIFPWKD